MSSTWRRPTSFEYYAYDDETAVHRRLFRRISRPPKLRRALEAANAERKPGGAQDGGPHPPVPAWQLPHRSPGRSDARWLTDCSTSRRDPRERPRRGYSRRPPSSANCRPGPDLTAVSIPSRGARAPHAEVAEASASPSPSSPKKTRAALREIDPRLPDRRQSRRHGAQFLVTIPSRTRRRVLRPQSPPTPRSTSVIGLTGASVASPTASPTTSWPSPTRSPSPSSHLELLKTDEKGFKTSLTPASHVPVPSALLRPPCATSPATKEASSTFRPQEDVDETAGRRRRRPHGGRTERWASRGRRLRAGLLEAFAVSPGR